LVESFFPNRKQVSKELQNSAFKADPFSAKSELYENNPKTITKEN